MWRPFQQKPIYIRENEAKEIADILFPAAEIVQEEGHTFQVDYSLDNNLSGALFDIEMGQVDIVTVKTINDVVIKLRQIREILKCYDFLDERAEYVVVKSKETTDIL